jgi:hypothetical protein
VHLISFMNVFKKVFYVLNRPASPSTMMYLNVFYSKYRLWKISLNEGKSRYLSNFHVISRTCT